MSEAMSSVETEDVLSSIRRLVSEDLRPASRPAAATATARPVAPAGDDKLLLTPALRVVSERPAAPRAPLPRLHLGIETPRSEEPPPLRAIDPAPADYESETGDPYPSDTRMEWSEEGWVLAPDLPEQVQAAAPDEAPMIEVDPDQDDLAIISPPQPEALRAEPEVTWPNANAFPEATFSEGPAQAQTQARADAAWADRAEAEVVASLDSAEDAPERVFVAPPAGAADEGLDPVVGANEVIFDEQVLRDLVRDILREELRGALGERITRNVRKLVHAEIARMIAAQDLDQP